MTFLSNIFYVFLSQDLFKCVMLATPEKGKKHLWIIICIKLNLKSKAEKAKVLDINKKQLKKY